MSDMRRVEAFSPHLRSCENVKRPLYFPPRGENRNWVIRLSNSSSLNWNWSGNVFPVSAKFLFHQKKYSYVKTWFSWENLHQLLLPRSPWKAPAVNGFNIKVRNIFISVPSPTCCNNRWSLQPTSRLLLQCRMNFPASWQARAAHAARGLGGHPRPCERWREHLRRESTSCLPRTIGSNTCLQPEVSASVT